MPNTPNLNLLKPTLSAFDIWGAGYNSNMDLLDAASASLRGTPVLATAPTAGQALVFNGTSWAPTSLSSSPSGAAGGDLGGSYPNPTVAKLSGVSIGAAPASGQVLTATSPTAAAWSTPAGFIDNEIPAGAINSVNVTLTLAQAPNPQNSLHLHINGQRLTPGAGNDYTLSGTVITLAVAPKTGGKPLADYRI